MTIADFFWSEGHVGWPLFGIIVFSVLCLLVTDVVWRLVQIAYCKLLVCVVLVWLVGILGLVIYCCA